MQRLAHSPNCVCEYCESKKKALPETSLEDGLIDRKPLRGDEYDEMMDKTYLDGDYKKENY